MARISVAGNKNATRRLFGPNWLSDQAAQAYGIAPGWEKLANVFEASVGSSLVSNGHRMITAGDGVIRRALNLPPSKKGVDFVTVRNGKIRLTEVKDGNNWDGALEQLENVYGAMENQNLSGNVTELHIAIPSTANTSVGTYSFQNGQLYSLGEKYLIGGLPVKLTQIDPLF